MRTYTVVYLSENGCKEGAKDQRHHFMRDMQHSNLRILIGYTATKIKPFSNPLFIRDFRLLDNLKSNTMIVNQILPNQIYIDELAYNHRLREDLMP